MRTLTLTLLASLFLACDRDPPTLSGAGSRAESGFDRAGRPELLNPRVVQFEDVVGLLVIDPGSDLFSVHVATDEPLECKTTPTLYTLADVEDVLEDPDDPVGARIREAALPRGVYVTVFSTWSGWRSSGYDCASLTPRKVAEGLGQLATTDGDFIAFLRQGAGAYGFEVRGRMEWSGGGVVGYVARSRCAWDRGQSISLACDDEIRSPRLER